MATALTDEQKQLRQQQQEQQKTAQKAEFQQRQDFQNRATTTNFPSPLENENIQLLPVATVPQQPLQPQPIGQFAAPAPAQTVVGQPPQQPQQFAAPPPPVQPDQLTQQVLQQAQQQAGRGFDSQTSQRLTELVNTFLQDPSFGRDPEKIKSAALATLDREQTQGIEEFRRESGAFSGTQRRADELIRKFTESGADRATLEAQLDAQELEAKRQDFVTAFGVAGEQVDRERGIFAGDIEAQLQTAQGALSFAQLAAEQQIRADDRQFELTTQTLRQEHEKALQNDDLASARQNLEAELDFRESQADLGREFTEQQTAIDRLLKESLNVMDIDAQREFLNLQAQIDSGRLLSVQDFEEAEAQLNRLQQTSIAQLETESRKELQQIQNDLVTSEAELDRAKDVAMQNTDVNTRIQMQESDQAVQVAESELERAQQFALQSSDQVHRTRVQNAQNDFNQAESSLNRAQELDLQQNTEASRLALQTAQNRFTQAESGLDRAQSEAMQNTSIEAQERMQLAEQGFEESQNNQKESLALLMQRVDQSTQRSLQIAQQNHQGNQANLDRAQELTTQERGIQAQKEIVTAQQNFERLQESAQRQWLSAERTATQGFVTGERIEQQRYNQAQQYLDRVHEVALSENNITAQKEIQQMQSNLQLQLQTQDMGFQEKMFTLDSEREQAVLDGNVGREQQILQFQHTQQLETMQVNQGFEQANLQFQSNLNNALAQQDFQRAKAMENIKFSNEYRMHYDNQQLEKARIDLAQQGIDVEKQFQDWNKIQSQVESGLLDPQVAIDYLKQNVPEGIEIKEANPMATQMAIIEDFNNLQLQFSQTHPGSAVFKDADGNIVPPETPGAFFSGLTNEWQAGFNSWMNNTVYEEGPLVFAQLLAKDLGNQPNQGTNQNTGSISITPNPTGGPQTVQTTGLDLGGGGAVSRRPDFSPGAGVAGGIGFGGTPAGLDFGGA